MNCTSCETSFEVAVGCPSCGAEVLPGPGGRRRTALLAIDRGDARASIGSTLRELGFDLVIHASSHGLYEEIFALRPDLAVLSVTLENELAVSLLERARQESVLSHTRLVLLGAIYRPDRFRARPSTYYGADAYIEAPVDPARLGRLVEELFTGPDSLRRGRS